MSYTRVREGQRTLYSLKESSTYLEEAQPCGCGLNLAMQDIDACRSWTTGINWLIC